MWMRRSVSSLTRKLLGLSVVSLAAFAPQSGALAAETRPTPSEVFGHLPLSFEPNVGQTDKRVRFLVRGRGYLLYVTDVEQVFVFGGRHAAPVRKRARFLRESGVVSSAADDSPTDEAENEAPAEVLRVRLEGASTPVTEPAERLPGIVNYFVGNDSSKWYANIPTYSKVRLREVYPGIDAVYYGVEGRLEYDFVVKPGGDPSRIRLVFEGQKALSLDAGGNLVIQLDHGQVVQHRPVVYQENGSVRVPIEGRFATDGERVRVELGAYDTGRALVVDPTLVYSTYLGRTGDDVAYALAVNGSGNAYVAGTTNSTDFPTTAGAFQTVRQGTYNAFVTKLNPSGSALVYSTYLGGERLDEVYALAVDGSGNAYVAGSTLSTTFPTTAGAFQTTYQGGTYVSGDAFLTKLRPHRVFLDR